MVTRWALQGPQQQELVIQPLKTECRTQLGSAEPTHLEDSNNRGVHIKMLIGLSGGVGCIATPLVISLNLSGQIHATPHLAQQVEGH